MARVGARGFSTYVSAAVDRQIQRDLLEELLQEKEAEIGPPTPEVEQWAAEIFRDAESMAAHEEVARSQGEDTGPQRHAHKAD
ncbi:CopG family transcriptional regulator [Streptomyces sp. NPDC006393]|uniref:CopG family transcriptional regulator n=1 Tax=Streptomyces sp. NPDC006393 TaxID=3156763 RepID=UPI00340B6F2B